MVSRCEKEKKAKYFSRNTPPYDANNCRVGMSKRGNNGEMYRVSRPNIHGWKRWVKTISARTVRPRKTSSTKAPPRNVRPRKTSNAKASPRNVRPRKTSNTKAPPGNGRPRKTSNAKSGSSMSSGRQPPTWRDVFGKWKQGNGLPKIKVSLNDTGVFWETSAVSSGGGSIYKEKMVSTRQLPINMPADPTPFDTHLHGKTTPVSFANLNGDAVLVCPPDIGLNYSHIGTFHKNASVCAIKTFWKRVALEVEKLLAKSPPGTKLYVNSHGTAVAWFHVRIDSQPKYYTTSLKNT